MLTTLLAAQNSIYIRNKFVLMSIAMQIAYGKIIVLSFPPMRGRLRNEEKYAVYVGTQPNNSIQHFMKSPLLEIKKLQCTHHLHKS